MKAMLWCGSICVVVVWIARVDDALPTLPPNTTTRTREQAVTKPIEGTGYENHPTSCRFGSYRRQGTLGPRPALRRWHWNVMPKGRSAHREGADPLP
jgi:hypothetical protein